MIIVLAGMPCEMRIARDACICSYLSRDRGSPFTCRPEHRLSAIHPVDELHAPGGPRGLTLSGCKTLILTASVQLWTTYKNNPNGVFVGPFVNKSVPALPTGSVYKAIASPIPDLTGLRK